jgi:hypothetical protein
MLDAEHRETARIDKLGVITVVGFVLIENMAQSVPVRRALDAQRQRVVGVADLVPVLLACDRVGAGGEHLMDRVEAPAEQPGLRTGAIEGNTEREDLAGADQARRLNDILGHDVIERADLVLFAPASPVLELLRCLGDRLFADLDVHKAVPSGLLVIAARSWSKDARSHSNIALAAGVSASGVRRCRF